MKIGLTNLKFDEMGLCPKPQQDYPAARKQGATSGVISN